MDKRLVTRRIIRAIVMPLMFVAQLASAQVVGPGGALDWLSWLSKCTGVPLPPGAAEAAALDAMYRKCTQTHGSNTQQIAECMVAAIGAYCKTNPNSSLCKVWPTIPSPINIMLCALQSAAGAGALLAQATDAMVTSIEKHYCKDMSCSQCIEQALGGVFQPGGAVHACEIYPPSDPRRAPCVRDACTKLCTEKILTSTAGNCKGDALGSSSSSDIKCCWDCVAACTGPAPRR